MIRESYINLQAIGATGCLRALASKITRSSSIYKVNRDDCKHPVLLRLNTSDVETYKQVFVDQEYDFDTQEQPSVIVDAGANIGLASIKFANDFPSATIIAIEPEERNFELLKRNTSGYPNIKPFQAAVWNHDGELSLLDNGFGEWGFMAAESGSLEDSQTNKLHAIRAVTIPTIMREFGFSRIDILKIDIEGAEKEVFSNSSQWIDCVESLIVELHERMKSGCNRSFYLGSDGFQYEWLQGENVYLTRGGLKQQAA